MMCDRCGAIGRDVTVISWCSECGQVPLCGECEKVHQGEAQIEAQMFGRTWLTPENVETTKVDMRHCGHEWCGCGCYGRPHCKLACGMDRRTPKNVECQTCHGNGTAGTSADGSHIVWQRCPDCPPPENVEASNGSTE